MVEVDCETDFAACSPALRAFAHEIALQVAAAAPQFVRDEDIPAKVLAEETRKAEIRARQEGKPEAIIPRIVAGMLEKYKSGAVLLRQASIRDDSLTVAEPAQPGSCRGARKHRHPPRGALGGRGRIKVNGFHTT